MIKSIPLHPFIVGYSCCTHSLEVRIQNERRSTTPTLFNSWSYEHVTLHRMAWLGSQNENEFPFSTKINFRKKYSKRKIGNFFPFSCLSLRILTWFQIVRLCWELITFAFIHSSLTTRYRELAEQWENEGKNISNGDGN